MTRLGYIVSCASAFALGAILPLRDTHAQSNSAPRMYYQISFMKSKPGQDWLKMERDLWKPIHQDRINGGHLNSWSVMEPIYSGPHPYDYITVEGSNSIDDFTKLDYPALMTKAWGKENFESRSSQTTNARDMLGTELWEVVESVSRSR